MSNALMAKFEADGKLVELDADTVKNYLVNGNGNVTDQEIALFINLCKYQCLNPFVREVYLIKYDDTKPATMVVGKDAFTRRAAQIKECKGWSAGVAVMTQKGDYLEREGTIVLKGETLAGGWCVVEREGWPKFKATVNLSEYHTGKSMWNKMPATMIRKVAIVQALRESFPDKFQGMYDQSEMGVNGELPEDEILRDTSKEPATATQKKMLNELIGKDKKKIEIAQKVLADYGYQACKDIKQGDYENIMEDLRSAFVELEQVIDIEPTLDFEEEIDIESELEEQAQIYGEDAPELRD